MLVGVLVLVMCETAVWTAAAGAVEREEDDEDGIGGAEGVSELVGGREEEEAGGGTMAGAVREVQLVRRCPTSPIRARNVR